MKSFGSTEEVLAKLPNLGALWEAGTPGGGVKSVDIRRNTKGEGTPLGGLSDAEERKLGERSRLETCVVLAVNAARYSDGFVGGKLTR